MLVPSGEQIISTIAPQAPTASNIAKAQATFNQAYPNATPANVFQSGSSGGGNAPTAPPSAPVPEVGAPNVSLVGGGVGYASPAGAITPIGPSMEGATEAARAGIAGNLYVNEYGKTMEVSKNADRGITVRDLTPPSATELRQAELIEYTRRAVDAGVDLPPGAGVDARGNIVYGAFEVRSGAEGTLTKAGTVIPYRAPGVPPASYVYKPSGPSGGFVQDNALFTPSSSILRQAGFTQDGAFWRVPQELGGGWYDPTTGRMAYGGAIPSWKVSVSETPRFKSYFKPVSNETFTITTSPEGFKTLTGPGYGPKGLVIGIDQDVFKKGQEAQYQARVREAAGPWGFGITESFLEKMGPFAQKYYAPVVGREAADLIAAVSKSFVNPALGFSFAGDTAREAAKALATRNPRLATGFGVDLSAVRNQPASFRLDVAEFERQRNEWNIVALLGVGPIMGVAGTASAEAGAAGISGVPLFVAGTVGLAGAWVESQRPNTQYPIPGGFAEIPAMYRVAGGALGGAAAIPAMNVLRTTPEEVQNIRNTIFEPSEPRTKLTFVAEQTGPGRTEAIFTNEKGTITGRVAGLHTEKTNLFDVSGQMEGAPFKEKILTTGEQGARGLAARPPLRYAGSIQEAGSPFPPGVAPKTDLDVYSQAGIFLAKVADTKAIGTVRAMSVKEGPSFIAKEVPLVGSKSFIEEAIPATKYASVARAEYLTSEKNFLGSEVEAAIYDITKSAGLLSGKGPALFRTSAAGGVSGTSGVSSARLVSEDFVGRMTAAVAQALEGKAVVGTPASIPAVAVPTTTSVIGEKTIQTTRPQTTTITRTASETLAALTNTRPAERTLSLSRTSLGLAERTGASLVQGLKEVSLEVQAQREVSPTMGSGITLASSVVPIIPTTFAPILRSGMAAPEGRRKHFGGDRFGWGQLGRFRPKLQKDLLSVVQEEARTLKPAEGILETPQAYRKLKEYLRGGALGRFAGK